MSPGHPIPACSPDGLQSLLSKCKSDKEAPGLPRGAAVPRAPAPSLLVAWCLKHQPPRSTPRCPHRDVFSTWACDPAAGGDNPFPQGPAQASLRKRAESRVPCFLLWARTVPGSFIYPVASSVLCHAVPALCWERGVQQEVNRLLLGRWRSRAGGETRTSASASATRINFPLSPDDARGQGLCLPHADVPGVQHK